MTTENSIELLAPAGSVTALKAVIEAGADAVYIGGSRFGARAYAENPDESDLVSALDYAHRRGAKTIAITDRDGTPMTEHSDVSLLATSSMASFVDSLTAPLSLINALLVTLGMHRKDHIKESLASLETLWSQYRVYETGRDRKDDSDYVL